MKHTLLSKQGIGSRKSRVVVKLIPDNETEAIAIRNVGIANASDNERELVENYLLFGLGLGNYSVISLNDHQNDVVTLDIINA